MYEGKKFKASLKIDFETRQNLVAAMEVWKVDFLKISKTYFVLTIKIIFSCQLLRFFITTKI